MYVFSTVDFPLGSDMMGTIQQGPRAEEHMETELLCRLHGLYDSPSCGLVIYRVSENVLHKRLPTVTTQK